MIHTIHGNALIGNEFLEAQLEFDQKIIALKKLGPAKTGLSKIIPGFIDLHVHGGGGADIMQASDAASIIASTHARFGTSSFLATTMTAPFDDLQKAFLAIKKSSDQKSKHEARILGIHLEGPFISSEKLGAQPNYVRQATLDEIKKLHALFPIKVVTLAPEVFSHLDLISDLVEMGIIVQVGHTNGTYEQGLQAINLGAKSFTHLFNAMSGLHHRSPGMVGAALAHAHYAELIPDLLHVHPGAIKAALRSIPNLYFVTDATSATGMPDGQYQLGTHTVHKCLGGVKLADGTLAGSALTMNQALLNLLSIGLSLEEASHRVSAIPAQLLNLSDRGVIDLHCFADFVVLNPDATIKEIYLEGELL